MFSETYCRNIEYELTTPLENFKFDAFKKAFFRKADATISEGVLFTAVLGSAKPGDDYHAHMSWNIVGERLKLNIEYWNGHNKPTKNESEPFADGLMQWLSRFFAKEQARAHTDAMFSYPSDKWQSALPLPIKLPLEPGKDSVEINGMSLVLPKNEAGMSEAWVIGKKDKIRTMIHGYRDIRFRQFSIQKEIDEVSLFSKALVRKVRDANSKRQYSG